MIDRFFLVAIRKKKEQSTQSSNPNNSPYEPFIKHIYPPEGEVKDPDATALATRVPLFCFPDDIQELVNTPATLTEDFNFTFVFTDIDGNQQFGVCRRIRPIKKSLKKSPSASASTTNTDEDLHTPEVLCILSKYNWLNFHFKILETIEERLLVSIQSVTDFVDALIKHPHPSLVEGKRQPFTLKVVAPPNSVLQNEYELFPPEDNSMFNDILFKTLFEQLSTENVLFLFSSLLAQHRIVVTSSSLTLVSSCVHILLTLLYPFQWPYIYVPVLPRALLEYCMAPVPFLIGVHSSSYEKLSKMDIDVVFVDLDNNSLTAPDENYIEEVPESSKLRQTLDKIVAEWKKSGYFNNNGVVEAFQSWYFQMFGTYRQFVTKNRDKNMLQFNKEEFINLRKKASIKKFLNEFCSSQMFERFIAKCEERVHPSTAADNIFETQINTIGDPSRIYDNTLS